MPLPISTPDPGQGPYLIQKLAQADLSLLSSKTFGAGSEGIPVGEPFVHGNSLWTATLLETSSGSGEYHLRYVEMDKANLASVLSSTQVALDTASPLPNSTPALTRPNGFRGDGLPFDLDEDSHWGIVPAADSVFVDSVVFTNHGIVVPRMPHANQLVAWDLSSKSIAWSKLGRANWDTEFTFYTPLLAINDDYLIVHWETHQYVRPNLTFQARDEVARSNAIDFSGNNTGSEGTLAEMQALDAQYDAIVADIPNGITLAHDNEIQRIDHGFYTIDVTTGNIVSTYEVPAQSPTVVVELIGPTNSLITDSTPDFCEDDQDSYSSSIWEPQTSVYQWRSPPIFPGVEFHRRCLDRGSQSYSFNADAYTNFDTGRCCTDGTNIYFLPRVFAFNGESSYPTIKAAAAFDPMARPGGASTWSALWEQSLPDFDGVDTYVSNGVLHQGRLLFHLEPTGIT